MTTRTTTTKRAPAKPRKAKADSLEEWRELARRLGRSPQYSIRADVSVRPGYGVNQDYGARSKLAAAALKEVAKQDSGHPSVQARERAQQNSAVVDARAHVLMYDSERFHIRQELATGKLSGAQRAAKVRRMRELDSKLGEYVAKETVAYETAYKAELKKIPKAPKAAPKRAPKKPLSTISGYQPKPATIAQIAAARRNPHVYALERAMHDAEIASRGGHDRTAYNRAADAYFRARDREIAKPARTARTARTAARAKAAPAHLSSGRDTHKWPYEHPSEHRAAALKGWRERRAG